MAKSLFTFFHKKMVENKKLTRAANFGTFSRISLGVHLLCYSLPSTCNENNDIKLEAEVSASFAIVHPCNQTCKNWKMKSKLELGLIFRSKECLWGSCLTFSPTLTKK